MGQSRTVVFSDLDGTLLDRETYSWEKASSALEQIRRRSIPLILSTSKTLAETLMLRQRLGNDHPFIVENGAAVAVPPGYFADRPGEELEAWNGFRLKRHGHGRDSILSLLRDLRTQQGFQFQGFGDWSLEQVVAKTGLPLDDASRALERFGSEPIEWRESDANLERFREQIHAAGLRLVQGGRFLHVMGQFDKAKAFLWLKSQYGPAVTVALGDSPNDEAMLDEADIAVIVRSEHSDRIALSRPQRVIRTEKPGSAGWQEAMEALLPELP